MFIFWEKKFIRNITNKRDVAEFEALSDAGVTYHTNISMFGSIVVGHIFHF